LVQVNRRDTAVREGVSKKGRSILEMRLEQRKKEVRELGGGR
jgi:hypothetical protein